MAWIIQITYDSKGSKKWHLHWSMLQKSIYYLINRHKYSLLSKINVRMGSECKHELNLIKK